MNPSSSRPDALGRHLRVWAFLTLEQTETAELLLPPDTWAHVYSKCRGTWALRLTSAGLLQLHSEIPALWFLTVPQLLGCFWKFLAQRQHPEVFSHIFASKFHSGEKAKHCSHGPAHTFTAEHSRPGSPIPNLTLVSVEQSRTSCKSNRKPFKYHVDVCEQQGV